MLAGNVGYDYAPKLYSGDEMIDALGFMCFGLFVLWVILAIVGYYLNKKAKESKQKREATYITQAKFQSVRVGMSFDEVVALIGRPEKQLASAGDADNDVSTFFWRGGVVAHAILVFQNGKLISKSQAGL